VVDASPLIVLIKSELDYLLPLVFKRVFITEAVLGEVLAGPENDLARRRISGLAWLIHIPTIPAHNDVAEHDLGVGETETLTAALHKPECCVLVDDAAARRCAKQLGISVIGTGGFLALAKRRGHLASLDDAIHAVRSSGLWISDGLVDLLLSKDRESQGNHPK